MEVSGFEAYITSLEDLILSKLIWIQELQSEKQIDDIKEITKEELLIFVKKHSS